MTKMCKNSHFWNLTIFGICQNFDDFRNVKIEVSDRFVQNRCKIDEIEKWWFLACSLSHFFDVEIHLMVIYRYIEIRCLQVLQKSVLKIDMSKCDFVTIYTRVKSPFLGRSLIYSCIFDVKIDIWKNDDFWVFFGVFDLFLMMF
jgi:hypothetical protein